MVRTIELSKYLKIRDLDLLEQGFKELEVIKAPQLQMIEQVLDEWQNEQALVNLFFYPQLIPEQRRVPVLLKALASEHAPYYVLAAVVGMQQLNPGYFSADDRQQLVTQLLGLVAENVALISARAAVTIWEYLEEHNLNDYLMLYPAKDSATNKNILAYILTKYADHTKRAFKRQLRAAGLPWGRRRRFVRCFKKFLKGKRTGSNVFMLTPVYVEIPCLADVDQRLDHTVSQEVALVS